MTDRANNPEQKLPVFKVVDGTLVRKSDDSRDPKRRYSHVAGPEGAYLREFTDDEERQRDEAETRWAAEAPQRTLEAERRKAEADAFRASLKYETRLIAFVDILGWTKAVRTASRDPEQIQKLGLVLNTIRSQIQQSKWMAKHGDADGWPGDPQVTQFSDCLTISTQADYIGKSQLVSALGFLSMSMLHQGFLLRGGLTIGELYHRECMVFGPAFLKAYELESRCAVYPRIILDPVLSEQWGQDDAYHEKGGRLIAHARTWRLSFDGFRFFDFLQPFGGTPTFSNSPDLIRHSLLPLRALLIENLKTHTGNAGIWSKYVWLANYFNDVCLEHKGHDIKPIELDPECS